MGIMSNTKFRGDRLKAFRDNAGLTQGELAERLTIDYGTPCNQAYVSFLERGSRRPRADILNALFSLFATSGRYLLGETDDDSPQAADPSHVFVRGGRPRDAALIQAIIDNIMALPAPQRAQTDEIVAHYLALPDIERVAIMTIITNAIPLPMQDKQTLAYLAHRMNEIKTPPIRTTEGDEIAKMVDKMPIEERPKALAAVQNIYNDNELDKEQADKEAALNLLSLLSDMVSSTVFAAVKRRILDRTGIDIDAIE